MLFPSLKYGEKEIPEKFLWGGGGGGEGGGGIYGEGYMERLMIRS